MSAELKPPKVWLSRVESGEHLGLSPRQISRLIAAGRLPAKRFGARTVRVHIDDLNALGVDVVPSDLDSKADA